VNLLAATGTDFLDLHSSVKFVAGAYIFVLLVIVSYVAIMARRLISNQRELAELRKLVEEREAEESVAGTTGFELGGTAAASAATADEHERAAEAIRSEHQL
jgi:HAMP domain-containing protein